MRTIASLIDRAITGRADEAALKKVKGDVLELAESFPLYGLPARIVAARA